MNKILKVVHRETGVKAEYFFLNQQCENVSEVKMYQCENVSELI